MKKRGGGALSAGAASHDRDGAVDADTVDTELERGSISSTPTTNFSEYPDAVRDGVATSENVCYMSLLVPDLIFLH